LARPLATTLPNEGDILLLFVKVHISRNLQDFGRFVRFCQKVGHAFPECFMFVAFDHHQDGLCQSEKLEENVFSIRDNHLDIGSVKKDDWDTCESD
jgi:hypothetical protein